MKDNTSQLATANHHFAEPDKEWNFSECSTGHDEYERYIATR